MKIKNLLTKTLLVAAGLLVGASNAWAAADAYGVDLDSYDKTTYNFTSMSGNLTIDNTADPYTVWSTKANSYKGGTMSVYPCTTTGMTRFAFEAVGGSAAWYFYGSNGLCNQTRTYSAAVTGLKTGNIVVFLYTRSGKVNFGNTAANTGPYTYGDEVTVTEATDNYNGRYYKKFTMTGDGVIGFDMNKWSSTANAGFIREIIVYTAKGTCADPTYSITGANNNARTFTLSCETDDSEIYYSTSELASAEGGTLYENAVETEATTIWAYAKTTSSTSAVISFSTGAGTTLQLNAPTFTKTAYSDGSYTVSIVNNQSSISPAPASSTIKYRVGTTGDYSTYSSAVPVEAGNTLYAYVEATGYTTSSVASDIAGVQPTFATDWSLDFTSGSVSYAETTFDGYYNLLNGSSEALNTNFGVSATENAGVNCWYIHNGGLYCYYSGGRAFALQNLTVGQFVRITTNTVPDSYTSNLTLQDEISYQHVYTFEVATAGTSWIKLPRNAILYKVEVLNPAESVTVTSAGYATYVSANDLDFSASTIKAYKVKVASAGVATMTKVDNVPAGTPVLLYKEGGATENIPVMTGAATVSDNDLVVGTGVAVATSETIDKVEYTNMILNNVSGIGFYLANGQTVATNRAYLHILSTLVSAGAPMMLMFADDMETTGISDVRSKTEDVRGDFFDLSGRRVAQPTKGLYIVNGKKVAIK